MSYDLGVDLGTTFTAAATARGDSVEIVTLGTSGSSIPSVILLEESGFVIGEPAEQRALSDPTRSAREFKRRVGDSTPILIGGTPYASHLLMGRLLEQVVALIVEREGEQPRRLVLTVPANWGEYRRELFAQVVNGLAAVPEVRVITEPEAAAIDYAARERVPVGSVVAVYDLGGGTFDAAVLRRDERGFTILGRPEGIEQLGGIDFDAALFAHVTEQSGIADVARSNADDPSFVAAMAQVRRGSVEAKIALSTNVNATIGVFVPGTSTQVRVTRAEFETLIGPLIDESVSALERAIGAAGAANEDLHAVLLVGGSSRIPLVAQRVTAALRRPVAVDADPKNSIARGAARAAALGLGTALKTAEVPRRGSTGTPPPPPPRPEEAAATGGPRRLVLIAAAALVVLVGIALLALLPGGDESDDNDEDRAGDAQAPTGGGDDGPLVLAAVLPLSGSFESSSAGQAAAIELAIADINAGGGVVGKPADLLIIDSGTEALQIREATERAIDDDGASGLIVDAGLGSMVEGMIPVAARASRPICSSDPAPLELVVETEAAPYFQLAPTSGAQAAGYVELALAAGVTDIGLLARNDESSAALADEINAQLESAGIGVARSVFDAGDASSADLSGFSDAQAVAVVAASTDAPSVFETLRQSGFALEDLPVFVNERLALSSIVNDVAPEDAAAISSVSGTRIVQPSTSDFDQRLRGAQDDDLSSTFSAAEAYDCTVLLALAATASGSTDPAAIAAEVVEVSRSGTACSTYQECRLLLEADEDIDYVGITGVELAASGRPSTTIVELWSFDDEGTVRVFDELEVTEPS